MSSATERAPSLAHAVALGALHGPAELLPISSSGHVELVPWLLRWDEAVADPELRKALEVALHAGTGIALLISLRDEIGETMRVMSPRLAATIALSAVPPAVVGLVLRRPIERHLGTPATIAAGLLAGAAAMAWADRAPQARSSQTAGAADALWLGLAQACALAPGVSRNGATLVAARARGFTRADAAKLSRHVALPVIAGATALTAFDLVANGLPARSARALAAGAAAAFASTLGSGWLIRHLEGGRALAPYALYRTALAAIVVRRLTANRPGSAGCTTMAR